jgi:ABC-type uncharacterized transport system substrate-binding protein
MKTMIYNPAEHFSKADEERLAEAAAKEGLTVGDFIEQTLKRQLWAVGQPEVETERGGK